MPLRYGLPADSDIREVVTAVGEVIGQLYADKKISSWSVSIDSSGLYEAIIDVPDSLLSVYIHFNEGKGLRIIEIIKSINPTSENIYWRRPVPINRIKDEILVLVDRILSLGS